MLLQIFEWAAMLYIIRTQRKRSVNQILYEHGAENVSHSIKFSLKKKAFKQDNLTYRRKERLMGILFVALSVLLVVLNAILPALQALGIISMNIMLSIFALQLLILQLCIFLFFSLIMFNMHKYHRYEYDKNKKQFSIFFIALSINISALFGFLIVLLNDFVLEFEMSFNGYWDFCQTKINEGSNRAKFIVNLSVILFVTFNVTYISPLVIFIKLKTSKDILQGISKLDYLLKVSIF